MIINNHYIDLSQIIGIGPVSKQEFGTPVKTMFYYNIYLQHYKVDITSPWLVMTQIEAQDEWEAFSNEYERVKAMILEARQFIPQIKNHE